VASTGKWEIASAHIASNITVIRFMFASSTPISQAVALLL
jgi:hypothetical protein